MASASSARDAARSTLDVNTGVLSNDAAHEIDNEALSETFHREK